jgi:hypothetical protein
MSPHDDERAAREAGPLTIDSDPNAPPPYAIQIHGEDGRWTTRIHGDGRVEFGEGVEPGEQGRRFWTAMSEDMAGVIEAARQAGRAEGERLALERVAGVIAQRALPPTRCMYCGGIGCGARGTACPRCDGEGEVPAQVEIAAALAREFGAAWPAKETP